MKDLALFTASRREGLAAIDCLWYISSKISSHANFFWVLLYHYHTIMSLIVHRKRRVHTKTCLEFLA